MTVGLIINPLSGKQSGKGLELAGALAGAPGVLIRVLDQFGHLNGFLDEMGKAGVSDLFISSGDGTIQEIQTQLAERKPFSSLPRLCLLPHGTTNLTAADLGFAHTSIARQTAFVTAAGAGKVANDLRTRTTLRIVNPRDGKTRHGMFLGTGAVWQATRFCQDAVHRTGLKGDWATFATLAAAIVKSVFSRSDPDDMERIDRPYQMTVRGDGAEILSGGELLFLATTLDKLILNTRPFWGGKQAAIRATSFPYPPPNLARWLYPALYGSEDRRMPPGCHSFSAGVIEIETECPFVLDGEFFDPPANAMLRIETGPEFTYVCG
jgi:diacylglycerol kinase family enzyme